MSASASRRGRYAPPLVLAALLLGACDQKSKTTMDLLRAGDPGICTAADVEETVRNIIRPGGVSTDAYTISFADASLESFDKVVSRATCNAALTIDGPNGSVAERTMIDFVVSPAAQNPSTFIVSGAFGSFTQRLADAVSDAAVARSEQDSERQAQDALAAMVKPGWLIGRWVKADQGSRFCAEGLFDQYLRGGRYVSGDTRGSWKLNDQDLTIIGSAATVVLPITDATMDSFTVETPNTEPQSFRRCSADELQSPVEISAEPSDAAGAQPVPDDEPTPQQ